MLNFNIFLQSFSNLFLDKFFLGISCLVTDIPLVAFLCYVYWCVNKEKGIKTGFILLNGMQLNFIVKDIFKIERPYIKNAKIINKDIKYGYGYSFPSNHSQLSASFLFSFKRYFNLGKIFLFGIILVFLIGLSRIYLGVHSIIDVAVGFLLGYFVVRILSGVIDKIMESRKYYIALLFVLTGLVGTIFFKDSDSLKIMCIYIGFFVGFLLEDKYIGYNIPEKLSCKIINYLIGVIGIVFIYILLSGFIKYFVLGLWITLPAPFIFKSIERKESK